jgi:ADP-ribosyl-[dinitrogen reductase] hydrolase
MGEPPSLEHSTIGCLLGTTVGDAIGLPGEGLARRRLARLMPDLDGHRFLFRRGMVSDDTEHTCMTAQAMVVAGGDAQQFARALAWQLRWWLLGVPAGVGFATLRATLKLWLGFPPECSGVFSAGNGPAMRSPIIGVCSGHDFETMRAFVRASTRLTHTDPKAEYGAVAVALAAHLAAHSDSDIPPPEYASTLRALLGAEADEFHALIDQAVASILAGDTTQAFADELGLADGVGGYVYHTVPVVLHCWLRNQTDYRAGILEIVRCGGDTDTTAAILGGIVGARVGRQGISREWIDGLWEWPRTVAWVQRLGESLAQACADGAPHRPPKLSRPGLMLRNILFLLVVLAHGIRRIFPPY